VIKELAICKFDGSIQSWIFAPPFGSSLLSKDIRKQNRWITNNLHGIDWMDGFVHATKISDIFRDYIPKGSVVYVKGEEKCKVLRGKLNGRHVSNLEEIGCPRADKIYGMEIQCLHSHPKTSRCALNKCLGYMNWFKDKKLFPLSTRV
jgi:hypothetical protein